MALRELVKGEKVLVLGYTGIYSFKKGQLVAAEGRLKNNFEQIVVDGHVSSASFERKKLLAIGDKVEPGPDMHKDSNVISDYDGMVGTVIKFLNNPCIKGRTVEVDWENDKTGTTWRMTADHQDLKPVGDSEAREEGKPECFGFYPCWGEVCTVGKCPSKIRKGESCKCSTCKVNTGEGNCREVAEANGENDAEIQSGAPNNPLRGNKSKLIVKTVTITIIDEENVMTREARAKQKDERVKSKKATIEEKKEAHAEEIAVLEESIVTLTAEAADLRDSTTDREAHIKLIAKANKVEIPQAEAMYELDKLNE